LILHVKGINNVVVFEEPISPDQPIVLVSTHCSVLDIDTNLAHFIKPVNFISKIENLKLPVVGIIIKYFGSIPVERGNRDQAFPAIRMAAAICKSENRTIGIYPEGTRR
jgi:1-acyl-sn-glycerol-3-phosphate acyltransferase